jgi:hypothetical protein
MLRKQILVALGMLAAVVVCVVVIGTFGLASPPPPHDFPESVADRLAFAARLMLVPGLCLLVGIGFTANRRFFSRAAIDGGLPPDDRVFEINLRYNQNTLEQTVLAAIAWTGVALTMAPQDLRMLYAMAGLFAVGRIAFWLGYLWAPWARAFGLGLTFYPTAAALVLLAVQAAR